MSAPSGPVLESPVASLDPEVADRALKRLWLLRSGGVVQSDPVDQGHSPNDVIDVTLVLRVSLAKAHFMGVPVNAVLDAFSRQDTQRLGALLPQSSRLLSRVWLSAQLPHCLFRLAAHGDWAQSFEWLMDQGFDPLAVHMDHDFRGGQQPHPGRTTLEEVGLQGATRVATLLASRLGPRVLETKSPSGLTPLLLALTGRHVEFLNRMMELNPSLLDSGFKFDGIHIKADDPSNHLSTEEYLEAVGRHDMANVVRSWRARLECLQVVNDFESTARLAQMP